MRVVEQVPQSDSHYKPHEKYFEGIEGEENIKGRTREFLDLAFRDATNYWLPLRLTRAEEWIDRAYSLAKETNAIIPRDMINKIRKQDIIASIKWVNPNFRTKSYPATPEITFLYR
mgnify:CR=1 FL=1